MKPNQVLEVIKSSIIMLFFLPVIFSNEGMAQSGFTQNDRDLLIELKTTVTQMEKRFEQVDKRIDELRQDMNKRIDELRQDMNNRFEQVDKRFEQVDKRSEQMMTFILAVAAIFGAMTAAIIGFALWDRRTMIRPFESKVMELEEKIKAVDTREKQDTIIAVLKEYAEQNKKLSDIIGSTNL